MSGNKPSVFARRHVQSVPVPEDQNDGFGTEPSFNISPTSERQHDTSVISSDATNSNIPELATSDLNQQLPSDNAQSMFSAMSEEDIYTTQVELMEKLNPDMVNFLKQKWSQRGIGQFSNDTEIGPPTTSVSHKKASNSVIQVSADSINSTSSPSRPSKEQTQTVLPSSTESGIPSFHRSEGLSDTKSHLSDIRDSVLIPKKNLEEKESEKMLWATDASVYIPSEANLDEILKTSVKTLGDIAAKRFDLNGSILSDEEIQTLPTHLGLHHHGASPSSAGYTLSDILTLLRSSLTTQRVMALQLVTAIVSKHGQKVADPLATSGALALAFAPFPSSNSFYSSVTCQLAYVGALQAFVNLCRNRKLNDPTMDNVRLIPDLFLASSFYSPAAYQKASRREPVLDALAQTDCVAILARIAFRNSSYVDEDAGVGEESGKHVAVLSLLVMRDLVTYEVGVCRALISQKPIANMLRILAISRDGNTGEHAAISSLLACDIIAQVFMRSAWSCKGLDQDGVRKKKEGFEDTEVGDDNGGDKDSEKYDDENVCDAFLGPTFLQDVCTRLSMILLDSALLSSVNLMHSAGALRVLRAGLTFQVGFTPFSATVQAICRLLYERSDVAAEAYLTLEAYVHCLHEFIARKVQTNQQKQTKGTESEINETRALSRRRKAHSDETSPTIAFIKDQVANLVPAALAAVKVFAGRSGTLKDSLVVRAAAGHFSATLVAVYRIPLGNELLALTLSSCSSACSDLVKSIPALDPDSDVDSDSALVFAQTASLCHAGARLLARVKLEPAYIQREIGPLMNAAQTERIIAERFDGDGSGVVTIWRPAANACAEWLGLLGRTERSCVSTAHAIELLPFLSDVQVIVDLLSRCILNAECLHALDGSLSLQTARNCAQDIIPVAYEGLLKLLENQSEEENSGVCHDGNDGAVLVSIFDLMQICTQKEECRSSVLHVLSALHEGNTVNSKLCFDFLLCATANFLEDEDIAQKASALLYMSGVATMAHHRKLIACKAETVLSTLSTVPNPKLANSILQLTDRLVCRGPLSQEPQEARKDDHNSCLDPLSSVVMSLILCLEVDISLRMKLWDMTVDACGGALLFFSANLIISMKDSCNDDDGVEESELMLCSFVRSIDRGILNEDRCPPVLARFIMKSLEKAMYEDENRECVKLIRQLLKSERDEGSSNRVQRTLSTLLKYAKDAQFVNKTIY